MGRFDALTNLEEEAKTPPTKAPSPLRRETVAAEKTPVPAASSNGTTASQRENGPQPVKANDAYDTVIPRYHETKHDTVIPRYHDTTSGELSEDISEVVRKAVKRFGKEAATHRFTLDEKNILAEIEYTYKRQGIKTSENEITRIAINYFIEDYRRNGELSILAKILNLLNS